MPQMLIQVITTGSRSLRDTITRDQKLQDYKLKVVQHKKSTRSPGWSKLRSTEGAHGALNMRWEGNFRMLLCRVVTKAGGMPGFIISDFVRYLLTRYKRKIQAISIIPR